MSDSHTTKIVFSKFNKIRHARGKDAAHFYIVDYDGESYWLWMSESDIRINIDLFPNCKEELEKGLMHY